jgi:hypothetical protein
MPANIPCITRAVESNFPFAAWWNAATARAAPSPTSAIVRIPALLWSRARSKPINAPQRVPTIIRMKTSSSFIIAAPLT